MIAAKSISNTLSRFLYAFSTADRTTVNRQEMANAYARFAEDNADYVEALFDDHFLEQHGRPAIDDFASKAISRRQAAIDLAKAWDRHVGPASSGVRKRRIADITVAAESFLQILFPVTRSVAPVSSHADKPVIERAWKGDETGLRMDWSVSGDG